MDSEKIKQLLNEMKPDVEGIKNRKRITFDKRYQNISRLFSELEKEVTNDKLDIIDDMEVLLESIKNIMSHKGKIVKLRNQMELRQTDLLHFVENIDEDEKFKNGVTEQQKIEIFNQLQDVRKVRRICKDLLEENEHIYSMFKSNNISTLLNNINHAKKVKQEKSKKSKKYTNRTNVIECLNM